MARTANPELKEKGLYKSSKEWSKEFDKTVDHVRLRVPGGWKEKMTAYAKQSDKYNSVNDMIVKLIQAEMGDILEANDSIILTDEAE